MARPGARPAAAGDWHARPGRVQHGRAARWHGTRERGARERGARGWGARGLAIGRGRAEEKVALLGRHLLSVDPPDHTRLRRLMSRALTARRIAALYEPTSRYVHGLLDEIGPRDRIDLLADYALPIAVTVICELLGVPVDDREDFRRWGLSLVRAELEDDASFDGVTEEMEGYLVPFILAQRSRPGAGLTAVLASARDEDKLDDYELISLVYQLFFAGHESSAYLICNAAYLLLAGNEAGEAGAATKNGEVVERAIEEVLRYEGPVKTPTWRFPTEDVRLGDVVFRRGEPILLLLAAADRDPEEFPQAETFDPWRSEAAHLAFGYGIHHCVGAAVGRMEGRVAVSALLERHPGAALAIDPAELRWRDNLMMRGVRSLPVRLGPRRS
ncbi:cytochrome P450 [Actinomadura barringtoniae]|uniref:Cytochrome P450 n=1 Tax=Actinomadura barringtoniae TaxID=1427535 RepID=A0A939TG08_9ACTN|nr:cytochrome P450 [Actinomadura barringtoniae]MBO2454945.1 cytochrome P450 [Actinomadura barringtoniae]